MQYKYPVYRYHITEKYYICLLPQICQAKVGIVENPEEVNDCILWMGFKTIKTFKAKTPRKAFNKAKKWIMKQPDRGIEYCWY